MNIKGLFLSGIVFCLLSSCDIFKQSDDIIYENSSYNVTRESVIQGDYRAVAVSDTEIRTNYVSPTENDISSVVEFRLSFNSKDNEFYNRKSHYAIIGESDSVIYHVGESQDYPTTENTKLAKNVKWVVRIDMAPVFEGFSKKGFYVTPSNDTINSADFKGVWIAGSVEPLTWDFDNLYAKDQLKFKPESKNSKIYSVELTLNPTTDNDAVSKSWKIDKIDKNYPQVNSGAVLVDALYNMAIENLKSNIRPDSTFRAGAGWDGVWTRDVSYSTYLALAYLNPDFAKNSLFKKVKNDRIIQDTGTGGSWPISSDRIVWATAAWEIYAFTGDRVWLQYSYNVIKNSIADDEKVVYDSNYNLMHGEQSYLDWREQSYPKWMQPKDIYESMTLGTNILFSHGYLILAKMSKELGIVDSNYEQKANQLKQAINEKMWLNNEGYYGGYLYGGVYPLLSSCIDNLGQSLSIIFDIASEGNAKSIISNTPITHFGTTSIYPMIKDIKPYHNDAVWPFVQSFWNLAAAKVKNKSAVNHGLGAMYRAAALFGTHKELFVASTGDYKGTAINSDKMLWSAAGNVAMIFRMFAGMNFETRGIVFKPFVPEFFEDGIRISNFKYRDSNIDVIINGYGDKLASITIDGVEVGDMCYPANFKGRHIVEITMNNNIDSDDEINLNYVVEMPESPRLRWNKMTSKIENFCDRCSYMVYLNGKRYVKEKTPTYIMPVAKVLTVATIEAKEGKYTGFSSKPYEQIPIDNVFSFSFNKYALSGTIYIPGNKSNEFVETSVSKNTIIEIPINIDKEGEYFADICYSNGSGPINTDNKCAIRTLFVNGEEVGAVVMPQRGLGEWQNTGFSNRLRVKLNKGNNILSVRYIVPQNINMNGEINTALLKYIRLIKK
ncbi:MAG: hypothetical protein PHR45_02010 [Muribaculaceae bacterium]|nr:hypothetical protein [Muribaculaceae bacterium]